MCWNWIKNVTFDEGKILALIHKNQRGDKSRAIGVESTKFNLIYKFIS